MDIIMKRIFKAENLKELEGFTIQSVTDLDGNSIILHLTTREGKKAEILVPTKGTHRSKIRDGLQEDKEESTTYYLDHFSDN